MDFSSLGDIDCGKGVGKHQCLYLGCHFANEISHLGQISDNRKH